MESDGLLSHSQVPATFLHPQPDRSSPCPPPPTSNFRKIHDNIILPSISGSSKWSLSLTFPHQNPIYVSLLPQTYYMPRPSHSSRLDHRTILGVPKYFNSSTLSKKLLNLYCHIQATGKYQKKKGGRGACITIYL